MALSLQGPLVCPCSGCSKIRQQAAMLDKASSGIGLVSGSASAEAGRPFVAYIYIYIYTHTYVFAFIYLFVYAFTYIYTHVYTHTYLHPHIGAYT